MTGNKDKKQLKIVLITSGQPSLNPRIIKEADTLADNGYEVVVIYAYWNQWGDSLDKQLLSEKKWKAIKVGGDPVKQLIIYFLSRLIYKLAGIGDEYFGLKYFAEFALTRSSYFLIREGKKQMADLYIGHNLAALPAVVKAAKVNNKPCGFDAEDFHRNEVSDNKQDRNVVLKSYIEDKYIPTLNYLTASSPLISAAYQQIYPDKKLVTIVNAFPKSTNDMPRQYSGPVKLFWFSQTIGRSRGLEDVADALKLLGHNFEFHLLGYYDEAYKEALIARNDAVHFHTPVQPDQIVHFASQFDIGIAPEISTPFNRDICLTNKLFTYMQAGLAIVASNTTAQANLLHENPSIGSLYEKGNAESLAAALSCYDDNRERLMETRMASLKLAHEKYNWEMESLKFLDVVRKTLSQA